MRLVCLLLSICPLAAWAEIAYRLRVDAPARSIAVSLTVSDAGANPVFRIPGWCPGFYFMLNYPEKISDVRASDASGRALKVDREGKYGWKVSSQGGSVTLSYRVLGDDAGLGFFGVSVHPHTAFVNGPAAFMYLDGRKDEPTTLELVIPPAWEVATAMRRDDQRWRADDYDELIDHPLQFGTFKRETFTIGGISFEAVFVSETERFNVDIPNEIRTLKAISESVLKLFGKAPFRRYLYLIHLSPGSFEGGLEHRASCVINVSDSRSLNIADLYAHEFVHAWNVKHIRPKPLGPFDYNQPCRTGLLWFFEGVTDYYAYRCTAQARLISTQDMLQVYADSIYELQTSKRRRSLTLEDVSRQTWENGGFGVGDYSYYTGGQVAGLILDLQLRNSSDGTKSLDHVMRDLFERFRLPKPGMDEDEIRETLIRYAGVEMGSLYDKLARSTQPLPLEVLTSTGFRYAAPGSSYPDLGFSIEDESVTDLSPEAEEMGLRESDVIISINDQPFTRYSFAGISDGYSLRVRRATTETTLRMRLVRRTAKEPLLRVNIFGSARSQKIAEGFLKEVGS